MSLTCFFFQAEYFFFFQAEDGIRDLVRSRGLGDVYQRQPPPPPRPGPPPARRPRRKRVVDHGRAGAVVGDVVSHTHLTLPTNYSV